MLRPPVALRALLIVLFAMGLFARVAPLVEGGDVSVPEGRLLSQWPTEDGYFMLTMGRNVGLGHGLSVAGGEMPTNGTQPLTTFVWAAAYAAVGGDRLLGVLIAQLFQLLAAAGTAFLLFRLGQRALAGRTHARETSAVAAITPIGLHADKPEPSCAQISLELRGTTSVWVRGAVDKNTSFLQALGGRVPG